MKKLSFFILAILFAAFIQAQETVKLEDVGKHIGDSVKVCTKIYGGIFLDRSKGTPTFLNAGGAYPNAPLTIVIWAEERKLFKQAPEVFYKNKNVCVTGKLILYKDKAEIVVYDEKQISIVE